MIEKLQNIFESFGYNCQPIGFERSVPYVKLRQRLKHEFADTEVSLLLRHLPDLFVMHHKMVNGIFFVKLLERENDLTKEERTTYEKFYPKDLLLVWITEEVGGLWLNCKWIGDRGRAVLLLNALNKRFNFAPPTAPIEALRQNGWVA